LVGIGLIVKPDFWFLHDFQSDRNLVYFGGPSACRSSCT